MSFAEMRNRATQLHRTMPTRMAVQNQLRKEFPDAADKMIKMAVYDIDRSRLNADIKATGAIKESVIRKIIKEEIQSILEEGVTSKSFTKDADAAEKELLDFIDIIAGREGFAPGSKQYLNKILKRLRLAANKEGASKAEGAR